MTTTASFEQAFIDLVKEIREELAGHDISRMCFRVEADGRTLDGDLAITFKIGFYGDDVTGNSVDSIIEEFVRQQTWKRRHAPLCLPKVETSTEASIF